MADEPCNICKAPYNKTVRDSEGKVTTERIECVGHIGILGYLWNKHPDYKGAELYRLNAARQRLGMAKK